LSLENSGVGSRIGAGKCDGAAAIRRSGEGTGAGGMTKIVFPLNFDANDPLLIQAVQELHEQFIRGEISQGHMAEKLGVSHVDLIHLLEALELQVTNL
jgi:hypothetical protein